MGKPCWDKVFLDLLDLSTDPAKKSDVAAIVMHEGLCHVCLVTTSMTVTRSRIERRMPKKKQGGQLYAKARLKFFEEIYEAIKTHIDFALIKVVLIGRYKRVLSISLARAWGPSPNILPPAVRGF